MSMQGRIGRAGGARVKRALGVQAILEWAFRVEKAQLELPQRRDIDEEGFGFGMEYVLIQRARLGCKVDGGGHKSQSYTHEDAEIVAATLAGMPDSLGGKRMAIYVAELARAGMTPDWMPGVVPRCVPVEIRLSHLDEAERRAYRIADNKLTELGEWDEAMLRDEIAGLLAEDFDLSLLGIADEDLDALLRDPDQTEGGAVEGEDDIPEPPVTPVSVTGDLWQLGSHRLICGDSTSADVVGRLLGDVKPLLMVTDPPYGVEYDPSWRNQAGAAKTKRTGKVLNDDRADWREAWALFPGDVAYVWHGALHATTVAESLVAAGFAVRSQIIWAKDRLVLSRGDYHWQHEPCWYAVKKTGKGHWAGDRKQTTLWHISGKDQDAATVHGTQKPVECMRRPMLNNSSPGQAVYEPFMGSGTTLIAAETTGRVSFGIELNPAYVDVAIERWQQFTGANAVLAETGETFADLKAKRLAA